MTAPRRVLVTGASGFVGLHLVPRLAARGDQVSALGPQEPGPPVRERLAGVFRADLRDAAGVREAVAAVRPDQVVHLAALSSAARSFRDPAETFAINATGTWHLLEAVAGAAPRARILLVSSGEVYGPGAEGSRTSEDAPMRPVSPYALSKAAAEALAVAAARAHDLDIVRARSFGHTGTGQTAGFVVPAWAAQIARIERETSEPVLKVGNLDVTRDFTDVTDVVAAYLALLDRAAPGAVYNVCSGTGVRLADLAVRLAGMAAVPIRIEPDPALHRPADVRWLGGDPSRIAAGIGWRATIPLERTLTDVLAFWRAERRS